VSELQDFEVEEFGPVSKIIKKLPHPTKSHSNSKILQRDKAYACLNRLRIKGMTEEEHERSHLWDPFLESQDVSVD